jgi:hypothetical protein
MKTPTLPQRRIAIFLACLVLCATGCASKQQSTGDISSVKPEQSIGPGGLTADQIQSQIMGFADTYLAYIRQAVEQVMSGDITPPERSAVYRAQLNTVYAAITIASSPNSLVAVMDMVVLVTLGRMVTEEYWIPEVYGARGLPVLKAMQTAEAEIWELAEQVMWPEQQQELREIIDRWWADHPGQIVISTIRLSELGQYRRQVRETGGKQRSSVFSFFYVDPLANLDPATREIKKTRELTERVFYYSERVPLLLNWMMRSLYYDLAAAAEMQQLMANADQVAGAFEGLPDVIAQERDAAVAQIAKNLAVEREQAINQFMDGLTDQREALKEDLAAEEERLQGALAEMKRTIDAGTELSSSLQTTVALLDGFVARFEKDPDAPAGEPFDINDYRQTAIELAEAARQLDELVASVDQLLVTAQPGEDEASYVTAVERLETSGAQLIDRAFQRGLVIVAVLVAGAVVVVLIGRLVPRTTPAR